MYLCISDKVLYTIIRNINNHIPTKSTYSIRGNAKYAPGIDYTRYAPWYHWYDHRNILNRDA